MALPYATSASSPIQFDEQYVPQQPSAQQASSASLAPCMRGQAGRAAQAQARTCEVEDAAKALLEERRNVLRREANAVGAQALSIQLHLHLRSVICMPAGHCMALLYFRSI